MKNKFPILAYENDCIVNVNGDITFPFEVELPKIYSLADDQLKDLKELWTKILKILPENFILHKQDVFYKNNYNTSKKDSDSLLALSSKLLYNKRVFLENRTFIFITMTKKINKTSIQSSLISSLKYESFSSKEIKSFFEVVDFVKEILDSERLINLLSLTKEDIIGNSKEFGILEKYINLDYSLNPTVSDYSYDSKNDYIKIGRKFLGGFALTETEQLPYEISHSALVNEYSTDNTEVYTSFLYPIATGLQVEHIVNQYFFINDQASFIATLEKEAKHQMSLSLLSKQNAHNASANEQFLNDITVSKERIISTAINVFYWEENFDSYSQARTFVKKAFNDMSEMHPKELTVNLFQTFWAGIAGNSSEYPNEDKLILPESVSTNLISGETFFKPSPINDYKDMTLPVILSDRVFGIPVVVDMMNRKKVNNFNKFVLGGSGGGKSFYTNHTVRQYFDNGAHVVIIDIGQSYFDLTQVIHEQTKGQHGLFYAYSEDNPLSINPFSSDTYSLSLEKKAFLNALMFTLWKKPDEQVTQAESTHVDTSINLYIEFAKQKKEIMSFNSYYEFLSSEFTTYVKNQKIETHNFDVYNFIQVLRPFYKGGGYDYLFNPKKETNIFHNRFVVFELDNIKEHPILYRVVTLIIIDIFIEKMRVLNKDIPKALLIEEAWKILSSEHTSNFVKELYKTSRKFSAEIWTITQDITDILNTTNASSAITKNSDYRIFLDVRKEKFNTKLFKGAFGLTDHEFDLLMSLNRNNHRTYKEVLICKSGKVDESNVYAVEVNTLEYATYTSDGKEVNRKKELEKTSKNHIEKLLKYSKELSTK